mgnify:CR=1 FL=1
MEELGFFSTESPIEYSSGLLFESFQQLIRVGSSITLSSRFLDGLVVSSCSIEDIQLMPGDASDIIATGADAYVFKELFDVLCIGIGAFVSSKRIDAGLMVKWPALISIGVRELFIADF